MIYHKKILLDQFTPIAQYDRLKALFKNEISFLFESAVNNERGNYSYIVVGVREKVWHENNKSYYQDENQNIVEVDTNPLSFLKKHYEQIDKQKYYILSAYGDLDCNGTMATFQRIVPLESSTCTPLPQEIYLEKIGE
jgi:hypothetical protein